MNLVIRPAVDTDAAALCAMLTIVADSDGLLTAYAQGRGVAAKMMEYAVQHDYVMLRRLSTP